jgi:hypothetical protein
MMGITSFLNLIFNYILSFHANFFPMSLCLHNKINVSKLIFSFTMFINSWNKKVSVQRNHKA